MSDVPESTVRAFIGMSLWSHTFPERFGVVPRLSLRFMLFFASVATLASDPFFGMGLHLILVEFGLVEHVRLTFFLSHRAINDLLAGILAVLDHAAFFEIKRNLHIDLAVFGF